MVLVVRACCRCFVSAGAWWSSALAAVRRCGRVVAVGLRARGGVRLGCWRVCACGFSFPDPRRVFVYILRATVAARVAGAGCFLCVSG